MIGKQIRITGTIQGVGFRPFVYRIALKHQIKGDVSNDTAGVLIHAYGSNSDLQKFIDEIRHHHPPLAVIRSITQNELSIDDIPGSFSIIESGAGEKITVDITVDSKVCDACLKEMNDPADRRHRYPFINCTDCGPRYTIITKLPYDRPNTTMAPFKMCPDCQAEYDNPSSRRFHAQPTCCPVCGPRLRLLDNKGKMVDEEDPIAQTARLLEQGSIIAIKGLGGFHLACRADQSKAVKRMRERKCREEKPFALMARDIACAKMIADISEIEERLLQSIETPIVLLQRKKSSLISNEIAPGLMTFGIMLPYTPIHHLLFESMKMDVLIMTSANRTDEPMVVSGDEAVERLGDIADYILDHDRAIHIRNDDSIVRLAGDKPVIMRRARGYVPDPLPSPKSVDGIVGCGGILKSSVTIGRGSVCYLSQYIGTIENTITYENYDHILHQLLKILDVKPRAFVCDSHPQAPGLDIAGKAGVPAIRIQHHYAHAVACMAENQINERCVCVVYDGTGYGDDGNTWGGEFFIADYSGYQRVGHLAYMPMPGADAAVHHPGRMALGALYKNLGDGILKAADWITKEEAESVLSLLKSNTNCPLTSGMGRLFDAASAILGICRYGSYEGQPAIMLEGSADLADSTELPLHITENSGMTLIDGGAILINMLELKRNGVPVSIISARFHNTIARHTAEIAVRIARSYHLSTICLTGGCFQNCLLLARTKSMIEAEGLKTVVHRLVPPNDGSISYGQAVAGAFAG